MRRTLVPVLLALSCGGGGDALPDGGGLDAVQEVAGDATAEAAQDGKADTAARPDDAGGESDAAAEADPASTGPDVAGLTGLDCKQFYRRCVSQCPVGADKLPDPGCFDACRVTLSANGGKTLDALLACVATSGCDAEPDDSAKLACYAGECADPYFACFHGEDSCKDVLACAQGCPQGEENGACLVACSQEGTVEAQKQIATILKCIGDECCPGDAAKCGTPQGQQCSKDVLGIGGACFALGMACVAG
ncbi:MAG: hypothetical protein FJ087_14710 [Deltaproteobacteria bacterium]|nr:hypothetical protein [Deltaproteobacteria bacterium]